MMTSFRQWSLCVSETCWTRLASEEVENSQSAHLKLRACLALRCSFKEALESNISWFGHFKHRKVWWWFWFLRCSCFKCWTRSVLSGAWYWHWRQTSLLMLLKWPILMWSFRVRIWSDENLKVELINHIF